MVNFDEFLKTFFCGQKLLPDLKFFENATFFGDFQTLCSIIGDQHFDGGSEFGIQWIQFH